MILGTDNRHGLKTFAMYECPEALLKILVVVNLNAIKPQPEMEKTLEFLHRVNAV